MCKRIICPSCTCVSVFLLCVYVYIYISSKCLCVSACTESNEYFLQSWSQDGRLTRGTRKPARCCLNLAAALAWWLHWSETSVCGSDWCILGRTSCCDWWTEKVICWLNCYIMADCYPFFCCARKKKKNNPKATNCEASCAGRGVVFMECDDDSYEEVLQMTDL